MELHQLRYLVAVAEEGSFTRAAAREHVAQPAVSTAIRQLERELGVELLERGRHGARPTEAGRVVLGHAQTALAAVAQARYSADELAGLLRGRVVVGMVVGCTSVVLAELLTDFSRRHPGIDVSLVEGASAALLADLREGVLDLAWVGRAAPPPEGIETAVLYEEEQVAVVAADLVDGGLDALPVADLSGRRLIALPRGTGGRTALDEACAREGVTAQVGFEATGLDMVLRLAAQGLATGIVPASVAAAYGGVRALPLQPPVRSRIEVAWRAAGPSSPAGRALVAAAREHVIRAADRARPGRG
jgi:DNA-binding transcriptional LysR family regulator